MVNPFNDPFNCNETASIFFRISCHVFWVNCSSFDDNKKRTNDKQTRGWVSCQKDSEREKKKKKIPEMVVNQLSAICLFVLESKYNININTSSFYIHVSIVDIYCWCWLLCHFFFNTWYQRPTGPTAQSQNVGPSLCCCSITDAQFIHAQPPVFVFIQCSKLCHNRINVLLLHIPLTIHQLPC